MTAPGRAAPATNRAATPDFEDPPVVEVALAVGLQPLSRFRVVDFGRLWEACYQAGFPKVELQASLPIAQEDLGAQTVATPSLSLQLATAPELPRVWFVDAIDSELVQIQNNWFARNWRRAAEAKTYPHYENLRGPFESDLRQFQTFVAEKELGEFRPVTCELSYFNHIVVDPELRGDLGQVLALLDRDSEQAAGMHPEASAFTSQWLLEDSSVPFARMYLRAETAVRKSDMAPIVVLSLTAKGPPIGTGIEGVLSFLDLAHRHSVSTFLTVTQRELQEAWGAT